MEQNCQVKIIIRFGTTSKRDRTTQTTTNNPKMKFALLVITSLVASAVAVPAAVPAAISYGSYGYSAGLPALSSYRSVGIPALSSGISGLGYGYGGYGGYGYGRALALAPAAGAIRVAAAPALSLAAAPAISYAAAPAIAAAPALSLAAAPALSLAAAPAISVAAAPAIAAPAGPVAAAIESRRSVEVVDVPTQQEAAAPQTVVIGPNVQPINLEFQTQASPLSANQNHLPTAPAEPQQSSFEEQPDLLRQDIVKPVVQDVYETIVPFRRITQELKPVQESLNQILPRGQERGFYQQQAIARPVAVAAAPAAVAVQAAPAAVAVQAAPAYSVAAAPAAVAVQAAPALSYGASYAAAPALSYGAIASPSYAIAKPAASIAYGSGITGLSYGGSYGSSYALKPVSSLGYTTLSGAYPIRKKK